MGKHNLDPYRCLCGKSFDTRQGLKAHQSMKKFCKPRYSADSKARAVMQGYHQDKKAGRV